MNSTWENFRDRNYLWLANALSEENGQEFPEALERFEKMDITEMNYIFSKMLITLVSNEVNGPCTAGK